MYYAWPHVMGVSSTVILLPYIVGVTTPILQRGNLTFRMSWVWAYPYFRQETTFRTSWVWSYSYFSKGIVVFIRAIRRGCDFTLVILKLPSKNKTEKYPGCGHSHRCMGLKHLYEKTEVPVWKEWSTCMKRLMYLYENHGCSHTNDAGDWSTCMKTTSVINTPTP